MPRSETKYMDNELRQYNQKILTGYGTLIFITLIGFGILKGLIIQQNEQATQYPSVQRLGSSSNYSRFPRYIKWDETYLSQDEFPKVQNWYSHAFDLSSETAAIERCIYLDGTDKQRLVTRHVTVFICDTPDGTMTFISRITSFGAN